VADLEIRAVEELVTGRRTEGKPSDCVLVAIPLLGVFMGPSVLDLKFF